MLTPPAAERSPTEPPPEPLPALLVARRVRLAATGAALIADVLPPLPREGPHPEDIPLEILYEDEHLAAINKPPGMVVHPARGHWTGTLVSALQHHFNQLSSVGGPTRPGIVHRLDRDTTGVLLLTNDGPLAHRLAHPRYGIEKTYVADVLGEPDDEDLRLLAEGVELEDGPTAPARVRRLGPSKLELVLHEGRNRLVRRMFEAAGIDVSSLVRTAIGPVRLGRLKEGGWRNLRSSEVRELLAYGVQTPSDPRRTDAVFIRHATRLAWVQIEVDEIDPYTQTTLNHLEALAFPFPTITWQSFELTRREVIRRADEYREQARRRLLFRQENPPNDDWLEPPRYETAGGP